MVRDTEVVRDRVVRPVATVEEGLRLLAPVITVRDTVGDPDGELSDPIVSKHKKRTLKIATSISSKAVPAKKSIKQVAKGCEVGLGKGCKCSSHKGTVIFLRTHTVLPWLSQPRPCGGRVVETESCVMSLHPPSHSR